jgi:hypothetical protein
MGSTGLRGRLGGRIAPPALALAATLGLITFQTAAGQTPAGQSAAKSVVKTSPTNVDTASPIKHLVVIFQENVSFDHYFGTYPKAANTSGEPFQASNFTPKVNGLANTPANTPGAGGTGNLLTNNPTRTRAATRSTRSGTTRPTSATC